MTNDELFGIINPATREWKDGLFSVIMRDQANLVGDNPKWIVLDGDIDPMYVIHVCFSFFFSPSSHLY